MLSAIALILAAYIVPHVEVDDFFGALFVMAVIGVLNAIVPPVLAAIRLPFTIATTFLLVLVADALMLIAADAVTDGAIRVDSFGWALLTALLAVGVPTVLSIVAGTNDDDEYTLRVTQRLARRSGEQISTDAPGIIFLEIDGLSKPVLQRAMRDGNAPQMARWIAEGTHRLIEWETDLSSQTGASQAGILLGSNEDIPAFRWVEKETGTLMVVLGAGRLRRDRAAPLDRRRPARDGGASRGNLLSGEADHVLLTVSRISAEKQANPGYRAFFANGFNVTRLLVLVLLGGRARADRGERGRSGATCSPRGHRGVQVRAHPRRRVRVRARPDRATACSPT